MQGLCAERVGWSLRSVEILVSPLLTSDHGDETIGNDHLFFFNVLDCLIIPVNTAKCYQGFIRGNP